MTEKYVVKSEKPGYELPKITLSEYLRNKIVEVDPNRIALIDTQSGTQLTYGQLHEKIQEVANGLLQLGITKQDMILFWSQNSLEYFLGEYAAIYLGVTFTSVSPLVGVFEMATQVENSQGTVMFIGKERMDLFRTALDDVKYQSKLSKLKILVEMGVEESDFSHSLAPSTVRSFRQVCQSGKGKTLNQVPHFDTKLTDPFTLLYSSGTTGLPKGAIHTQRSFLATVIASKIESQFDGCTVIMWRSLGHISGVLFPARHFQSGCTVVLHDSSNLDSIMSTIAKYRVEYFSFAPVQAQNLANDGFHTKYDLSCLKFMFYGSAKTPEHFVDKIKEIYKIPVIERYGATECIGHVWSTTDHPSKRAFVGKIQPNCEMKVIDLETGDSLPPNKQGELCFRGPCCFEGYFNDEKNTKETIDEKGWYHSGDLGYYDEDGEIFVLERMKEIFKYYGFTFIPSELEEFLLTLDVVDGTCVVGVKHETEGLIPRAYVKLAEGKTATEEDILRSVQQSMGNCKWLRGGVRFVSQMTLTTIGKVDRKFYKNLVKDEVINSISEV